MEELINKEQLADNIETVLTLEWLGIRFEDTKEENGSCGLFSKTAYYFSVPEASTITTEDKELNDRIQTANGLKYFAKEQLINMMINSFESAYGDDKEFTDDVRNNIHDYFKFYAKVRVGEIWNKELGDKRIKELTEEIKEASKYREI